MPKKKPEENRKPIKIRTGDDVIVTTGKSRGSEPRKVLSTLPKERKVVVEGVNVRKDRVRSKTNSGQIEVTEKPFPIDVSNVKLYDPTTKQGTRVAVRPQSDGSRTRVSVKSGQPL
jgi:large subunit ribosomal protein L24